MPPSARRLVLALTMLLLAGAVQAATPPVRTRPSQPHASVVTNPDWVTIPTSEEVENYYPAAAAIAGISGQAIISCEVTVEGTLQLCKIDRETPAGYGFGDAALRMSVLFRMQPKSLDGTPVAGGAVRIPLNFEAAEPSTPPIGPPAGGQFVFAGPTPKMAGSSEAPVHAYYYVRLPASPPENGLISVWVLRMFDQPVADTAGSASYIFHLAAFDCVHRSGQRPGSQVFDDRDRIMGWIAPGDAWIPLRPEFGMDGVFEIACASTPATRPVLSGLAAVRADARRRASAEKPDAP